VSAITFRRAVSTYKWPSSAATVLTGLGAIPMDDQTKLDDQTKHRQRGLPDLTFVLWATVVAIGAIVATLVLGVAPNIDPQQTLSIFTAP
jgi:hypothetical protein